MSKIKLILFTKIRTKNILVLVNDFLQRAKQFITVDFKEYKFKDNRQDQILKKQKQMIEEEQGKKGLNYLILLDINGERLSSQRLASIIEQKCFIEGKNLIFAIGSPNGWGQELPLADMYISLSSLTFSAELSSLIISEQIYRSLAIINNLPYHK